MWVKIKGQLINLNHIANIYWDERKNNKLYLTLHPANRNSYNREFYFIWDIDEYNPDTIEEINDLFNTIAEATDTFKPIFKHELANRQKVI